MIYPIYWLIDPFYFLKIYQRKKAENHFNYLESKNEPNNKVNEECQSEDYSQKRLNE